MRTTLWTLALSVAFAAMLRSEQHSIKPERSEVKGKYDIKDAVEKKVAQFGEVYSIVIRELRGQIVGKLYGEAGEKVLGALSPCFSEPNIVQKLMLVGAGCMSPDTKATIAMILQDVLQQLDYSSTCPNLPVDLRPDLENLIATSILQGLNFTAPWRGSLGMWRLVTPPPMERDDLYYLYETGQLPLEVPEDTSEWQSVLKSLAASRTFDPVEVGKVLDLHLDKSSALGVRYSQVLHDSLWYVYDAVETMCLFAKPIAEMIDVPRARIAGG